MLNLISFFGLFAMLGLAWLMSSARWQVNWRLVVMGVGLQIVLAIIFFNSQHWTFPRYFDNWQSLQQSLESEQVTGDQVASALRAASRDPQRDRRRATVIRVGEQEFASLSELQQALTTGDLSVAEINRTLIREPLPVARYPNGVVFYGVERFFAVIQLSVDAGSSFVFGVHADPEDDPPTNFRAILSSFAFGVLPTVIFFASLMSVLYYLGVMQWLIRGMAWVMQKTLGTTGAESLAAAANVFIGQTEAPLVVRPYIPTMTRSELNALMVGGFSTITGSLMAVFAGIGVSAGHLVTASIISAPAALVLAKILQPETETPVEMDKAEAKLEHSASNVIEAAATGASEGMKLVLNIVAMLIAFLALIALIDFILQGIGSLIYLDLSLSVLFGLAFWPLAWLMGIEASDCAVAGDLLGQKMVINEFVAYLGLLEVTNGAREGVTISERTEIILIYALCGFSNFGSIGIQLGGITPLAPERRSEIAKLGLRAMLGGMLACCMTACIAGVFYGWF